MTLDLLAMIAQRQITGGAIATDQDDDVGTLAATTFRLQSRRPTVLMRSSACAVLLADPHSRGRRVELNWREPRR